MSATRQKIDWARRAISEMRKAEASFSKDDFLYHFGAFLALVGALRQFITVDPHKTWVYGMDEQNTDYCACIDLRNIDVHVANAGSGARSHYQVGLHASLGGRPPAPPTTVKVSFIVDPGTLPSSFAVLKHSGLARLIKSTEEARLQSTPVVDLCEGALDFYENTVLSAAIAKGISIP